ncbi:hypothetical protein EJO68_11100 [Variovorax atrisoli]|uniref:hypothetical protein n=1 Tax=Variovorax atrisoli TaxID=3394203 RepID=UPI000F7FA5AA|nr:hypothetical protein [Variovorax sp. 369]RTD94333.1 hypothetical protein EJO68_11100 [Variovorax sp. 369]
MKIPLPFLLKATALLVALGLVFTVVPLLIAAVLPRGNRVADRLRLFSSYVPVAVMFCIAHFQILLAMVVIVVGLAIALLHA